MANFLKKFRKGSKKAEPKPAFDDKEEITVVLKYRAHCNHCNKEVENCIKKVKGVSSVEIDVENSEATVTGGFDVEDLRKHIFKKLKKRVEISSPKRVELDGSSCNNDDDYDDSDEDIGSEEIKVVRRVRI